MAKSTIVKYKDLEILTKPETIMKFREGKLNLDSVLISDDIYKNSKKGEKAKSKDLSKIFGTDNNEICLKEMLEKGSFSMTTKEKNAQMEFRKNEIINYFHSHYLDPKTKDPYSRTTVENAFKGIKFRIDTNCPLSKQVKECKKSLISVIPLKPSESNPPLF